MPASDAHLLYRFWRFLTTAVLTPLFRPRICGVERLPQTGGVLLCMNHECYLDPFFAGIAVRPRTVWFLASKHLWNSRILGYLLTNHWNSIQVDQEQLSFATVKKAIRLLQDGKAVMLFPEGERTWDGKLGRAMPGTGLIVAKAGVPVVPIRIFGGHEAWPRGGWPRPRRVTLKFGEPIDFAPLLAQAGRDREVYQQIADRIMDDIAGLSLDEQ